jgi:hypothetical protein
VPRAPGSIPIEPPKLRAFAVTLFLLASSLACLALDQPPAPLPSSAPADVFSADRAMALVQHIAVAPHPVGTREHDRVRDEIIAELTRLGVAPALQRTIGITPLYQVAGGVENILARVKGTSGKRDAVLLAAHYDSVPAGPGAGDDASGVAALLEALRALSAGAALRNDVIFLFSDGEEEGMLGASGFVAEHPWASDVRVVLNFEARGTGGVSQVFETSPGNGPLIHALARAPHSRGSSLAYEVYKRMPNDTDLTVLKRAGAAAMNFGFIGQWESYHTPLDHPGRLDRGSLQQHGEAALSLARSFGNTDLEALRGADDVFFNVLSGPMVHYPAGFGWLLCFVAAALWTGIGVWGRRANVLAWSGVAYGALAQLIAMLVSLVVAFGYAHGVQVVHAHLPWEGDVLRDGWYSLSLCALLTASWVGLHRLLPERRRGPGLYLGGAAIVLALAFVGTRWLPGGAFFFVWPLFGLLLASLVAFRPVTPDAPITMASLCLFALPPVVLLVPLLRGLHEALGFGPESAVGIALVLAVALIAIAPLLDSILAATGNMVPVGALVAAVLSSIGAAVAARYSPEHPKPSMLAYALDTSQKKAQWACFAQRTDPWTAQFLGDAPERGKLSGFYPDWLPFPLLLHDAPPLPIAPPSAVLVDESANGAMRTLRILISSSRQARTLTILAPAADVLEGWIEGKRLGSPSEARWNRGNAWTLGYANLPAAGIELTLRVKGNRPLPLTVIDRSAGLPDVPGATFTPRPPDSMPIHTGDQTMVLARFEF